MTSIDVQTPLIEAWETEDGDMVVWGTHDAELAEAASDPYWAQNEYPTDQRPTHIAWDLEAAQMWADPSLREVEANWPVGSFGGQQKPGWEPLLVLGSWIR